MGTWRSTFLPSFHSFVEDEYEYDDEDDQILCTSVAAIT